MKKNKTNLEIVSRRENFTVRAIVKGNNIIIVYDKSENQVIGGVFSGQRGTQGSPEFTGDEAFSGSFDRQKFIINYNDKYKLGDGAVYDEICAICQEIANPETQEPQADDTSV